MRLAKGWVKALKIGSIAAWLLGAAAGVLLTRDQPGHWTEMLIYSFILPVLLAAFLYGRVGGLLVALIASLISGSLVIGEAMQLDSPLVQRVLFQIIFFNTVALVTSELSEREREAQSHYRSLFEKVQIGLYRTTPDGRFLDINPALVEILGYSDREALQGARAMDFYVNPRDRQHWQAQMEGQGHVHNIKARFRRRDGAIIWTLDSSWAYRDSEGKLVYYEGSLQDITQRVRAEEKLAAIHLLERELVLSKDVQRIASAVVETAHYVLDFGICSLWLVDAEVQTLTCQAVVTDQIPLADIEALPLEQEHEITVRTFHKGKSIYVTDVVQDPRYLPRGLNTRSELCVPLKVGERIIGVLDAKSDQVDAFDQKERGLFQTLADAAAVALENARLHQELAGQAAWLEQQVAERTAQLQERVHEVERYNEAMACLLQDLQAAHEAAQEATRRLEEANAELESFAYSVSHDLRAPLRALDGFSRILLTDYAAAIPDGAGRYLQMIWDNAQHMGQLIDDLLTFSRLSRQPLKKQPVDLSALARQVLNDLLPKDPDHRVEIAIGDLPACRGDPALLRQVLINLFSNALKFSHPRELAHLEIGALQEEGQTVYFVRDNGVGFDMRYADKLFGVFQRLHSNQAYEGTGVGLAIVQRIIKRHGGRVWAEGQVDHGATFYFTLGGDNDAQD
ncbi:MAG: PAS domain S-box protein [Chloroflexia bacterium]|nr:PAS domain S-box protein [Chloroflexia bacterium]